MLLYCTFANPPNLQEWSLLTHVISECVLYYWKESCSNYGLHLFRCICGFRLTTRKFVYWSLYTNTSSLKSQSAPGFQFPYFFKCVIPVIHPWATMMAPLLDFSTSLLSAWTMKNRTKQFLKDLEHDFYGFLFSLWQTNNWPSHQNLVGDLANIFMISVSWLTGHMSYLAEEVRG